MKPSLVRCAQSLRLGRPNLVARLALGALVAAGAVAGCAANGPAEPAATTETSAAAGGAFTMTDTVWQWESMTLRPSGDTTTVPDPAKYTVVFAQDGTLSGQADCNEYGGTWAMDGGGYRIQLETPTTASCGETSLDQEFVQSLAMVVAGGPDGTGKLALESAGGERRMVFLNGGPAVSQ